MGGRCVCAFTFPDASWVCCRAYTLSPPLPSLLLHSPAPSEPPLMVHRSQRNHLWSLYGHVAACEGEGWGSHLVWRLGGSGLCEQLWRDAESVVVQRLRSSPRNPDRKPLDGTAPSSPVTHVNWGQRSFPYNRLNRSRHFYTCSFCWSRFLLFRVVNKIGWRNAANLST